MSRGLSGARVAVMDLLPIIHADADAFYAACHMAEDDTLRSRPIAVAGDPNTRHGVILAANYPARAYGIRTAMRLGEARYRCPDLITIAPQRELYKAYSIRMREIFHQWTPWVEPLSIDEAWLDLSHQLDQWNNDSVIAGRALQNAIFQRLGLTVSLGISASKMLAKQVSDWDKPSGLTVLRVEEIPERLWPRPVEELFGCGPATAKRLAQWNIKTIGDLAKSMPTLLQPLGIHGERLRARARGLDDTPVIPPRANDRQSVSVERTLPYNLLPRALTDQSWEPLIAELMTRLQATGMESTTLVVKYRTGHFITHTRRITSSAAIHTASHVLILLHQILKRSPITEPVRLIGLGLVDLTLVKAEQMRFWDDL